MRRLQLSPLGGVPVGENDAGLMPASNSEPVVTSACIMPPITGKIGKACAHALLVVSLASATGVAQTQPQIPPCTPGDEQRTIDLPWESWLKSPKKPALPWHITLMQPRLTFAQRFIIPFVVTIPDTLRGRDLHLLVKAGDGTSWFPDEAYAHFPVPPTLTAKTDIEFTFAAYASPGSYKLAVILYDALLQQHQIAIRDLKVAPVRSDPVPQLDAGIKGIEFLPGFGNDSLRPQRAGEQDAENCHAQGVPDGFSKIDNARLYGSLLMPTSAPGHPLQVDAPVPTRIDVVADFSFDPEVDARVWQMLQVVSLLRPVVGCTLLHVTNLERQEPVFDGMGDSVDWKALASRMRETNPNVIAVAALSGSPQRGAFFLLNLTRILEDEKGCPSSSQIGHRILIFLSGQSLPDSHTSAIAELAMDQNVTAFDLHEVWRQHGEFGRLDALPSSLKPLHARWLDTSDPMKFRKAVAALVAAIQQSKPSLPDEHR